jgi:hypothetical protein
MLTFFDYFRDDKYFELLMGMKNFLLTLHINKKFKLVSELIK